MVWCLYGVKPLFEPMGPLWTKLDPYEPNSEILNQSTKILFEENAFESVCCNM